MRGTLAELLKVMLFKLVLMKKLTVSEIVFF